MLHTFLSTLFKRKSSGTFTEAWEVAKLNGFEKKFLSGTKKAHTFL